MDEISEIGKKVAEEVDAKEAEKKVWEVSVKEGLLTCTIDLKGPDAITVALGVCDRIKSLVMSMEAKAHMKRDMEEMARKQRGIINPSVAYPQRGRG
jgi:hypothetical protein